MGRPLRRTPPGGVHHVWAHELEGRRFFGDDDDRRLLLALVVEARRAHGLVVLAWTLMGNHVHLVVEDPSGALSAGMHLVGSRFGRHRAACLGSRGPVHRSRFGSRLLGDDADLAWVVRYVVRNPVKHGACSVPADWRWGGHHLLVARRPDPVLDRARLLAHFGPDPVAALAAYRSLVEAPGTPHEPPPPGLPRALLEEERPSLEELVEAHGVVEAARLGRAWRYTVAEVAAGLELPARRVRWLCTGT